MKEPVPSALSAPDREHAARLAVDASKKAAATIAAAVTKDRIAAQNRQNTGPLNKTEIERTADETITAAAPLGFPATWNTVDWNPPVHRATSGAFVDFKEGKGVEMDGESSRSSVLGANSIRDRRALKGVIYQHIAHPEEWDISDENIQILQDRGAGVYTKDSGRLKDIRYGFRFHYNPSTIDFGISLNGTDINPALITSGQAISMPITAGEGSPTVRVQFFLNRMEDMTLLARKRADPDEMARYRSARDKWEASGGAKESMRPTRPLGDRQVKEEDLKYFYGRSLTTEEETGIYNRGTGYDLEFLFRTVLGKPWKTLLRGTTADVGIAFGMPLILDLSVQQDPGGGTAGTGGNRYLGRVSSISYSHLSFDHRMVPIWTQCAMDFIRYPDGIPEGGIVPAGAYVKANIAQSVREIEREAERAAAAAGLAGMLAGASPNKRGGGTPAQTNGRGGQPNDRGLD